MGMDERAVKWIGELLTEHKQRVRVGSELSGDTNIVSNIPQKAAS